MGKWYKNKKKEVNYLRCFSFFIIEKNNTILNVRDFYSGLFISTALIFVNSFRSDQEMEYLILKVE